MANFTNVKPTTKIRAKIANGKFFCMALPCRFSTRSLAALIRHQNNGCITNA